MEEQEKEMATEAPAEGAQQMAAQQTVVAAKGPSKWARRLRSAGALVAFAAIGVALVLALGPVFQPKGNSADAGMINASSNAFTGEAPDTIDAVFIGDSETYTSLSPMEMWKTHGLTTYNCSTSGQTLPYCSTLLDRVLKTQHPKVVFLEANALFRRFSYEKVVARRGERRLPRVGTSRPLEAADLGRLRYRSRQHLDRQPQGLQDALQAQGARPGKDCPG